MPAVLGRPTGDEARRAYVDAWLAAFPAVHAQPRTLVLRDYHVDNLMGLAGRDGVQACGLLDFQDAVAGPAAYDLMSLLEDARRDVGADLAADMLARYLGALPTLSQDEFMSAYAILGAQRHAKVIGIFTRLDRRDGKSNYLVHISRVWRLLEGALVHPALGGGGGMDGAAHTPRGAANAYCPGRRTMTENAAPGRAMVLAAGKGTRLRPLTDTVPKPLVEVGGRTLIEHALDRLQEAGVETAVVNLHHLGHMIEEKLAGRPAPEIVYFAGGRASRDRRRRGQGPAPSGRRARSTWSTAISCGSTARIRRWRAWPPPGTTGPWMGCCCSIPRSRHTATRGAAIFGWTKSACCPVARSA